jgi:polyphosphate glucokinase
VSKNGTKDAAGDDKKPAASTEAPDPERVTGAPQHPLTLAIDVGGTGIKASVLDAAGKMVADRVRIPTTYPLAPEAFLDAVARLVKPLPTYDRVAVGFPGVVRAGRVITAPHFVTASGPGTTIVPELVKAWGDFAMAPELESRLGHPVRLANDADLQGLAVVTGKGLEFVITLGTGVGTALFEEGHLAPHLEFAHTPFRKGETYNEQIGEAALEKIGPRKWRKRVTLALETFSDLVNFDHCFIGGGNARLLVGKIAEPYSIVDNVAGILGGIKLFEATDHLELGSPSPTPDTAVDASAASSEDSHPAAAEPEAVPGA